jgi:hypothetical protein
VAWTLGNDGDAEVLAAADATARRFMDHPDEALDPDAIAVAVSLAAGHSDTRFFDVLTAQVERPSRPENRDIALSALGSVHDPTLVRRVLEWTLSANLTAAEVSDLFGRLAFERTTRQAVYDWIATRWYFVNDKWRGSAMWPVWRVVRFACDDGQREKLEAVFKPAGVSASDWFQKAAEWYGEQTEWAAACSSLKQYGAEGFAKYLRALATGKTSTSHSATPASPIAAPTARR